MPDDSNDVGMEGCEGKWCGKPLSSAVLPRHVAGSSRVSRESSYSRGVLHSSVPAWFLALTRHDPTAHGDGQWSPAMHITVMSPEGWVGPGDGHSTGSPPHPCKRGFSKGGSWVQEAEEGSGPRALPFGPFPAWSSRVGPGAGGHRRELGSFLCLLLGGRRPGVGDSHAGPGCELLLGAGAAPHGPTTACGTQDVLGRKQEPGWSRGGCLHPLGSPHLISSSRWAMGPQCRRAFGAVACSHGGTSRAGEWHVPMAGTSPFESSVSARHRVSPSPPSSGQGAWVTPMFSL